MTEKFKSFLLNDHIFYGLLVVLVGVGSFGLGRASVAKELENPSIFQSVEQSNPETKEMDVQKINEILPGTSFSETAVEELVASKSGTKYHLTTCGGAKQIKPENKIFFSSRAAAEAAGYKPAANCPGLQ